ncbi:hypothetical protein PROFUN_08054 [Planoprotostelium fungivorum]|uniref:Uncharacterized protein n=1 Tax=Planoprotostelium fungivorum TaxID=1890364 RepID=A0A2P6NKL7_9EUKA|nr:hypothetical protein PROFUN_08054 [Planoprotostelium fungivorum]
MSIGFDSPEGQGGTFDFQDVQSNNHVHFSPHRHDLKSEPFGGTPIRDLSRDLHHSNDITPNSFFAARSHHLGDLEGRGGPTSRPSWGTEFRSPQREADTSSTPLRSTQRSRSTDRRRSSSSVYDGVRLTGCPLDLGHVPHSSVKSSRIIVENDTEERVTLHFGMEATDARSFRSWTLYFDGESLVQVKRMTLNPREKEMFVIQFQPMDYTSEDGAVSYDANLFMDIIIEGEKKKRRKYPLRATVGYPRLQIPRDITEIIFERRDEEKELRLRNSGCIDLTVQLHGPDWLVVDKDILLPPGRQRKLVLRIQPHLTTDSEKSGDLLMTTGEGHIYRLPLRTKPNTDNETKKVSLRGEKMDNTCPLLFRRLTQVGHATRMMIRLKTKNFSQVRLCVVDDSGAFSMEKGGEKKNVVVIEELGGELKVILSFSPPHRGYFRGILQVDTKDKEGRVSRHETPIEGHGGICDVKMIDKKKTDSKHVSLTLRNDGDRPAFVLCRASTTNQMSPCVSPNRVIIRPGSWLKIHDEDFFKRHRQLGYYFVGEDIDTSLISPHDEGRQCISSTAESLLFDTMREIIIHVKKNQPKREKVFRSSQIYFNRHCVVFPTTAVSQENAFHYPRDPITIEPHGTTSFQVQIEPQSPGKKYSQCLFYVEEKETIHCIYLMGTSQPNTNAIDLGKRFVGARGIYKMKINNRGREKVGINLSLSTTSQDISIPHTSVVVPPTSYYHMSKAGILNGIITVVPQAGSALHVNVYGICSRQ